MAKKNATKNTKKKTVKKRARSVPVVALLLTVCEAVSRSPSGQPTLYGLFDAITTDKFPLTYKPFTLYAQLAGDGEYQIAIELRSPDGTVNKVGEMTIECKPEGHVHVEIILAGLQFPKPGNYQIALTNKGRNVGQPKMIALLKKRSK